MIFASDVHGIHVYVQAGYSMERLGERKAPRKAPRKAALVSGQLLPIFGSVIFWCKHENRKQGMAGAVVRRANHEYEYKLQGITF